MCKMGMIVLFSSYYNDIFLFDDVFNNDEN